MRSVGGPFSPEALWSGDTELGLIGFILADGLSSRLQTRLIWLFLRNLLAHRSLIQVGPVACERRSPDRQDQGARLRIPQGTLGPVPRSSDHREGSSRRSGTAYSGVRPAIRVARTNRPTGWISMGPAITYERARAGTFGAGQGERRYGECDRPEVCCPFNRFIGARRRLVEDRPWCPLAGSGRDSADR